MLTVKCPNCGRGVEVSSKFLGRQVGCVNCRHVYILSEQYHDFRYKQMVIFNTVTVCLILLGIFIKIELDYEFVGKSVKAANKFVGKKMDDLFKKEESSDELDFFDFDRAYGTIADKFNRMQPIVFPEHKGRIVEWGGEVLGVYAVDDHLYGNYFIRFRQSQGSSSAVTVYFLDDQAEGLASIQKGHYLKYQGVIVSAAYGNTDHILRRGKILE
ncbi:MAG: hypothetical protein FVQ82_06155 [Planctomycetes bacterium]|nr:hypothetical protein [Planctomycetota bacterium]